MIPKGTRTSRPAPLRDRTLALQAARAAYVRALRHAAKAAEHLELTATECRRAEQAASLKPMASEHSITLSYLLGVAE
jgi:hypothetical protein